MTTPSKCGCAIMCGCVLFGLVQGQGCPTGAFVSLPLDETGRVDGDAAEEDPRSVLSTEIVCPAVVVELAPPVGQTGSAARGLNDHGQVVGGSDRSAWLWQNGQTLELGTLGGESASAWSINSVGRIAVWSENQWGFDRAAISENGAMVDLLGLGGNATRAYCATDAGLIVGYSEYLPNQNVKRPVYWDGGPGATAINLPGAVHGLARHANDAGDIIGWASDATPGSADDVDLRLTQGYLRYVDGRLTELGVLPGYAYCKPLQINNTGQIVGHVFNRPSDPSAGTDLGRPFLWYNGLMTDLALGSDASRALAINESGQIVGEWEGRAFLWEDGALIDLNDRLPAESEWVLEAATAINNVGQIAGQGVFRGQARGFLLTLCEN